MKGAKFGIKAKKNHIVWFFFLSEPSYKAITFERLSESEATVVCSDANLVGVLRSTVKVDAGRTLLEDKILPAEFLCTEHSLRTLAGRSTKKT